MYDPPPHRGGAAAFEAPAYPLRLYDAHDYAFHPVPHLTPEQMKIRTLFVSGLPDDVKPREIHNLFRRRHGFDHCLLEYTGRGNQVVAFAKFFTHESAMEALETLNGTIFDPQTRATLHIELARSNSRNKSFQDSSGYVVIDKRANVTKDDHETSSNDDDDVYDEEGRDDDSDDDRSGENSGIPTSASVSSNVRSEKLSAADIPPCSTLFIANLGPHCTEEELREALSIFPGFQALKLKGRGGMPVAFADFEDAKSSTEAMKGLQGKSLPSSDRGGLHIEYAKSKMRKV